jgi:NAD(P)-dependent dehydrogenase (short-subunit alcohol dehydrogenase family)
MDSVQRVFVTGGTSGIGAAIARAFAAAGASVTATGATPAEVEAAQALPANRLIAFHMMDVRQAEHVRAHLGEYTALDVLVNCAGIIQRNAEQIGRASCRERV